MTPDTWASLGGLIERYGLPLVILGGFLWLLLTGRVVLGRSHDAAIVAAQNAAAAAVVAKAEALAAANQVIAEWRDRWSQERIDRIAAEQALREFAPVLKDLAEGVSDLAAQKALDGK